MTREEMLGILHAITFRAKFTLLTNEYCIEADIITGDGTSYSWIGYDEWNVYELNEINSKQWSSILNKIKNNCLSKEDICNTVLYKLATNYNTENLDLSTFFKSLEDFPDQCPQKFYCIVEEDFNIKFYSNQEELALELKKEYANCVNEWDEMDDEELEDWISKYNEYQDIPCFTFK